MEEKIAELLLSLGMAPNLKGFRASVYAIELLLKDPDILDKITARLYPEVAKKLGSTLSGVERAIRHAIVRMFDRQDHQRIVDILGMETNINSGVYTNSEFLALCSMKLRRDFRLR